MIDAESKPEDKDPLLEITESLTHEQVQLLTGRIAAHQEQLCVVTIEERSTSEVPFIHREPGPLGDGGTLTKYHRHTHMFAWCADQAPNPITSGQLIIPTEQHIYVGYKETAEYPRTREWLAPPLDDLLLAIGPLVNGDIIHSYLRNKQFGLSLEFPTSDQPTAPHLIGGPHISVSFYIGNERTYNFLCLSKFAGHEDLFLKWCGAIEDLGCQLWDFHSKKRAEIIAANKVSLLRALLSAAAHGDDKKEFAELAKELAEKHGLENVTEMTLGQLLSITARLN